MPGLFGIPIVVIVDDYFGDDIKSLREDLQVNLIIVVIDVEGDILKLCEQQAPSQNGVDLKFSLLAPTGALYVMIM